MLVHANAALGDHAAVLAHNIVVLALDVNVEHGLLLGHKVTLITHKGWQDLALVGYVHVSFQVALQRRGEGTEVAVVADAHMFGLHVFGEVGFGRALVITLVT